MSKTFEADTYLYNPEPRLFLAGEAWPEGDWRDSPAAFEAAGIVLPPDHDGDGVPGGSTKTPEKDAVIAELETIPGARFDRRWGLAKLQAALAEAKAAG